MRLKILDELNSELTRLYMAGSRFAAGDPKLQRIAANLSETSSKSPVLKKLAENCAALVNCGAEESADKLSELSQLLTAVLHTQNETGLTGDFEKTENAATAVLPKEQQNYSVIFPLISFLSQKDATFSQDNLKALIENSSDFRLYPYLSRAVEYKPFDSISKAILAAGKDMVYYLEADFNITGGKADAKRLSLLSSIDFERAEQIALETVNAEVVTEMTVEAINILGKDKRHEKLILAFADDKKQEIREAAMSALAAGGSREGMEKILKYLGSKKYFCAVNPAAAINERGFSLAALNIVKSVFESAKQDKKLAADAEKILPALKNKSYPEIFAFYREMADCADGVGFSKSRGWENLRLYSALISNVASADAQAAAAFFEYYSQSPLSQSPTNWGSPYMLALTADVSAFSKEHTYSKLHGIYKNNKIDLDIFAVDYRNLDNRWYSLFAEKKHYKAIARALYLFNNFEKKTQKSIMDAAAECISGFEASGYENTYAFADLLQYYINYAEKKEISRTADTLLKCFSKTDKGYYYYFQTKSYQDIFKQLYHDEPEKLKQYAAKAAKDANSFANKIFEYILSVI